jgi:hypothetical protein
MQLAMCIGAASMPVMWTVPCGIHMPSLPCHVSPRRVMMPPGAAGSRGAQKAALAGVLYDKVGTGGAQLEQQSRLGQDERQLLTQVQCLWNAGLRRLEHPVANSPHQPPCGRQACNCLLYPGQFQHPECMITNRVTTRVTQHEILHAARLQYAMLEPCSPEMHPCPNTPPPSPCCCPEH